MPDGIRPAADGTQEFESGEHERAYILRMAANACKDLLKSPWRRRTCDLEACAQVPAPETSDVGARGGESVAGPLPLSDLPLLL